MARKKIIKVFVAVLVAAFVFFNNIGVALAASPGEGDYKDYVDVTLSGQDGVIYSVGADDANHYYDGSVEYEVIISNLSSYYPVYLSGYMMIPINLAIPNLLNIPVDDIYVDGLVSDSAFDDVIVACDYYVKAIGGASTPVGIVSISLLNFVLAPKQVVTIPVEIGLYGFASNSKGLYADAYTVKNNYRSYPLVLSFLYANRTAPVGSEVSALNNIYNRQQTIANQEKAQRESIAAAQASQSAEQHKEAIEGYDNTGANGQAQRLDEDVGNLESAESELKELASEGLDFEFDDGDIFSKTNAAFEFINTVLAAFIVKLGDFYSVVLVLLIISVAMMFIGRRKT